MDDKKNKSWPVSIIIIYSVFAAGLLGFWYFSTYNRVELVTERYYEKDLIYEAQITRIRNSNALEQKPGFVLNRKAGVLILEMPSNFVSQNLRGKIKLFRPSQAQLDRSINLACNTINKQIISIANMPAGKWRFQLTWSDGQKEYYWEDILVL
jgi:hypothetical protein